MPGKSRGALALLYGGAALTLLVTLFVFAYRSGLAEHLRTGYPGLAPAKIDEGVTAYTVILVVMGALGLLGWLVTVLGARAGKGWARWLGSGLFVVALCLVLAALTVRDTNGEVGLVPLLGWSQVLPLVPGLAAVVLLWRRVR
ncbi:hypothetical protein ACIA8R_21455 [Nonomuraea sp. NPDC051191]|uniref:hypothetical protein n=1 Tax=Nonomuraea sp. NPDC051191 TaxID=3364372 RepID=UPI0037BAED9A